MTRPVVLLGLGFTTRRLARRLLLRDAPVFAAVRNGSRFADLAYLGLDVEDLYSGQFPANSVLVHTVPPLPADADIILREAIKRIKPARVLYISSTGVYGSQEAVDENTSALASDEKARVRIDDENWLLHGPWETLIIRPAAIYGPHRGVHLRVLERRLPRGDAGGVTSRIHVDDLASVLEAATRSDIAGAWPLADDYPCASLEIAVWCAELFRLGLTDGWQGRFPNQGRSVDGRMIRELLGVPLMYPKYDSGILACVAEEGLAKQQGQR